MKKRAIGAVIAAIVIAIAAGCSGGTIHDNDEVYFPEGFRNGGRAWTNASGYSATISQNDFRIEVPNGDAVTRSSRYGAFTVNWTNSSDERVVTITATQSDAGYTMTDTFTLSPDGSELTVDLGGEPSLHVILKRAN